MFEDIAKPSIDITEIGGNVADIAKEASEAAEKKWNELAQADIVSQIVEQSGKLADEVWETCGPAVEAAKDTISDGAKDVAYVGAAGVLGAADFVEGAVVTVPVWVDVALGRREEAEGMLEAQFFHGLANSLQETMQPSEMAQHVGDVAFDVGGAAAGMATAVAAVATAAASVPVAPVALGAVASLGAAGEVLHHGYAEEGELTNETVAESAVAAVVTVVGIAAAGQALEKPPVQHIETINDHLVGNVHPETGVPFHEVQVTLPNGNVIEGVFPEFESVLDVQLPQELYGASNYQQFQLANQVLHNAVQESPALQQFFTPEQISQIADGILSGQAPDGFTWHHNEITGVLQLVDSVVHAATGHTGGQFLWGALIR